MLQINIALLPASNGWGFMDINQLNTNSATIPIVVDSVKNLNAYEMTRCTYFSIESIESSPGWILHSDDIDINFFMTGLSGVITSPQDDGLLFDTQDKLDHLFNAIDEHNNLYVDVNDVWLPNELFKEKKHTDPERGDVFRIGHELFKLAYTLKEEANTDEYFLHRINQLEIPKTLIFSEQETSELSKWNLNQIKINKVHYHERSELNLPKDDNKQQPPPLLTL